MRFRQLLLAVLLEVWRPSPTQGAGLRAPVQPPMPTGAHWSTSVYSGWSEDVVFAITASKGDLSSVAFYDGIRASAAPGRSYLTSRLGGNAKARSVVCKIGYIVTRVWFEEGETILRCTRLRQGHAWETEAIETLRASASRSSGTQYCSEGSVLAGLECDRGECRDKRLLCARITKVPATVSVSGYWGHRISDHRYTIDQSSPESSKILFGESDSWALGDGKAIIAKSFFGNDASAALTEKFRGLTYRQAMSSHLDTRKRPSCSFQQCPTGKSAWVYRQRVEAADKTGWFDAPSACDIVCAVTQPKCPPRYCGDVDCQCCISAAENVFEGSFPRC